MNPGGGAGRLHRFRLFVARNTIPMVWIWAGAMLCGFGTVYYRLRNGEDVTGELASRRNYVCT